MKKVHSLVMMITLLGCNDGGAGADRDGRTGGNGMETTGGNGTETTGGNGNPDGIENDEALLAKLRECGTIGEGKVNWPREEGEDADCPRECLLTSSCPDLTAFMCEEPTLTNLVACITACETPVGCSDGSNDDLLELDVCDGLVDCDDGADEEGCSDGQGPGLECDGKGASDPDLACDGWDDCEDGSDEKDCEGKRFACGDDENDGLVSLDAVCDLTPDCDNGADEQQGCAVPMCGN